MTTELVKGHSLIESASVITKTIEETQVLIAVTTSTVARALEKKMDMYLMHSGSEVKHCQDIRCYKLPFPTFPLSSGTNRRALNRIILLWLIWTTHIHRAKYICSIHQCTWLMKLRAFPTGSRNVYAEMTDMRFWHLHRLAVWKLTFKKIDTKKVWVKQGQLLRKTL